MYVLLHFFYYLLICYLSKKNEYMYRICIYINVHHPGGTFVYRGVQKINQLTLFTFESSCLLYRSFQNRQAQFFFSGLKLAHQSEAIQLPLVITSVAEKIFRTFQPCFT